MAMAMELLVEQIPNSYTYKRQYMEQHATSLQTLILGSSYAYDGIDAELKAQPQCQKERGGDPYRIQNHHHGGAQGAAPIMACHNMIHTQNSFQIKYPKRGDKNGRKRI